MATGAQVGHHGMHELGCADDRAHRAGLDAQSAADAARLVDERHAARPLDSVFRIEGLVFAAQQRRELADPGLAPRRALIDAGLALRDRFGVRTAARIAALRTLRLRQQRIDPFDELVHRTPCLAARPPTISPPTGGPSL